MTNLLWVDTGQQAKPSPVNVGNSVSGGPVIYVDGKIYQSQLAGGNVYGVQLSAGTPVIVLDLGQGGGPVLFTTSRGNEFIVNPDTFLSGEVTQLAQLSESSYVVRSSVPLLAFAIKATPQVSVSEVSRSQLNVTVNLKNLKVVDFSNQSIEIPNYDYVLFLALYESTGNTHGTLLSDINESPLGLSVSAGSSSATNITITQIFTLTTSGVKTNTNATVFLAIYFQVDYSGYTTYYTYVVANTTTIT